MSVARLRLAPVGETVGDTVGDSGYGQHDAAWLAFYEYMRDIVGLADQTAALGGLWEIAQSAGWWLPHEHICWITERTSRVCRDEQGQVHRDAGPAVAYRDGWSIFALHGVRVPRALVMTPAERCDAREWVINQPNAEIRREAVRKIGIERICMELGATRIDRRGDEYELLLLDLGDGRRRPYLKMRNPSIGVWHVEGVAPEITTVEGALRWRNGTDRTPEVLT